MLCDHSIIAMRVSAARGFVIAALILCLVVDLIDAKPQRTDQRGSGPNGRDKGATDKKERTQKREKMKQVCNSMLVDSEASSRLSDITDCCLVSLCHRRTRHKPPLVKQANRRKTKGP